MSRDTLHPKKREMRRLLFVFMVAAFAFGGAYVGWYANNALKARGLPSYDWEATPSVQAQPVSVPADFRQSVKRIMPSVVSVDRLERFVNFWSEEVRIRPTGTGSGVVISKDGYILTNNHVVEDADVVQVRLYDKRVLDAKVVGNDPRSDLAVLKIDAPNLVPAQMGSSSQLEVGQWVIALGNPLGYANTVSVGVVSNKGRTLTVDGRTALIDAIQTDAAINQGNSGGALANAEGQLVGINSAIISPTGGNIGIGFAIPIDRAKRIVSDIVRFGKARYGWLGVQVYEHAGLLRVPRIRRQLEAELGVAPPEAGLLVESVGQSSAARRSGIAPLDVLLAVEGKTLEEPSDLNIILADKKPGDVVKVRYWSKGETKSLNVTLIDE